MSTYKFKIGGNAYEVTVGSIADGKADVTVNGKAYSVDIEDFAGPAPAMPAAPAAASAPQAAPAAPAATKPAAGGPGKKITSPLPGVIIEVSVKEGDSVKAGQKVAVIEAMKMENEIQAESDGTVLKIHVSKGDSILEGADIVTIG